MPRRKKAIAVDLADLAGALEDHSDLAWYLDTKTGEVLPVPDDADDELLPVPREELVESDRFTFIEPLESRLGWEEMRDFAGRVEDRRLRELLEVALAGKGAFGRFKAVLADFPQERARWFAEHDQHMEVQVRAWLDRQGIAWTAKVVTLSEVDSPGRRGVEGTGQRERSAGAAARPAAARCEFCSGKSQSEHWIEVSPEGEGIACVTVDVTVRLCPNHRARLLQALNQEDSDRIEPSREMKPWSAPE
jgi:hypothetical protein